MHSSSIASIMDIDQIVLELFSTLHIDGDDLSMDYDKALHNIRQKCTTFYNCDFSEQATQKFEENSLAHTEYAPFYENIKLAQVKLANILYLCKWQGAPIVSIKNVHYLSLGPEACITLLRSLSYRDYYKSSKAAVPFFSEQVPNLTVSLEKKLLFIMFVLNDFGMHEAAGVIAALFLCGGV